MGTQPSTTRHSGRLDLAKRLSKALAGEGRCAGLSQLWSDAEAAIDPYGDPAAQVALTCCADCPLSTTCRRWAETDHYTGIAAGTHWINGRVDQQ